MVTKPVIKFGRSIICEGMKAVLVNFDLNLSSQHWILMLFVKGMRLVTCFAIYLTVTNMSKMALIKSATLNTIEIPKTSFTFWCKIGK